MHEQTTHFACADAQGTVASVTQTLGVPFGSGFAVPGTGLVLNNILKWMDRDPESPNVLRPGKKAGTMMSPTQVFTDGAFSLSIGTPGSYGILQTTTQMLLNVPARHEHPGGHRGAAGARTATAWWMPRGGFGRDALGPAGRGHEVNVTEDWS